MPRSRKAQDLRADLLAQVPPGATRVKVKTDTGQIRYRDIDKVGDRDEIQVSTAGKPIVMRKKPGRKNKTVVEPVTDAVRELVERKEKVIQEDGILKTARQDSDSADVLHGVILGIGEEVASLGFERKEAERQGKETSQISVRRISGLKALAETWLRRKDQQLGKDLNVDSPAFQEAIRYVMETLKEAMSGCGVRGEMIQTVFGKFSETASTAAWEAELKARVKQKT